MRKTCLYSGTHDIPGTEEGKNPKDVTDRFRKGACSVLSTSVIIREATQISSNYLNCLSHGLHRRCYGVSFADRRRKWPDELPTHLPVVVPGTCHRLCLSTRAHQPGPPQPPTLAAFVSPLLENAHASFDLNSPLPTISKFGCRFALNWPPFTIATESPVLPTSQRQTAMSDRSEAVELRDGMANAANGRLPENDDHKDSMEQKLDLEGVQLFPTQTMPVMKKAKRKDDGPLEMVCKWIVEYQVGTSFLLLLQSWKMTDAELPRPLRQPSHAPGPDPFVLPPCPQTHTQVLRALLLQP
jgi:hypothetical protein